MIVSRLSQEARVAEQLEQQGVSDELLDMWRTTETKVLLPRGSASPCAPVASTASRERSKAIHLLKCLVNGASAGASTEADLKQWFDAVLRLDVHLIHNPNALLGNTSIPTLCAALVSLGQKVEGGNRNYVSYDNRGLIHRAAHTMNSLLVAAGEDPVVLCGDCPDLRTIEANVLTSIQWRLMLPTVPEWIKMMNMRLDTITCGQFQQVVAVLWRCSSAWAWTVAHKCPPTANSAPRQVAQGLLCLACVSNGVLPAALLDLDSTDVLSLGPVPSSTLAEMSAKGQAVFLAALLAATQATYASLREDVVMVCAMLSSSSKASAT